VKIRRNLPHEHLSPFFEAIEERAVTPVGFVERPGRHVDAMLGRAIDHRQTDLWLRAELDRLGDVVSSAAFRIVGPLLGQVDFTIQQALKARCAVAEMHADNAVVDLATTAEPLPGGRRRVRAALGRAGFIEAPDRPGMRVLPGDDPLALVAHLSLFPLDGLHKTL
jgi:hypothetical protein